MIELGEKFFKIFDGHAACGAAAGDPGKVGGVEAEFTHPGFHAWGEKAGAGGVSGDGKASDSGLNAGILGGSGEGVCGVGVIRGWGGMGRGVEACSSGLGFRDIEKAEDGADGVTLA